MPRMAFDADRALVLARTTFDIEATAARDATSEELKRGVAVSQPSRTQWH